MRPMHGPLKTFILKRKRRFTIFLMYLKAIYWFLSKAVLAEIKNRTDMMTRKSPTSASMSVSVSED